MAIIVLAIVFSVSFETCAAMSVRPPAVNASWRPNDVRIPFIIQHPLTIEMMKKGFPDIRNELVLQYVPFFRKILNRETVKILILGGSFTVGTGCCEHHAWPERFASWLRRAYPGIDFHIISHALGSTSSLYGMHVVMEQGAVDLAIVDYSLNDAGSLAAHRDAVMLAVTENIVRTLREKGSAVVYICEYMYGEAVETIYGRVLDHYNASLVSYRAAVKTEVLAAEKLPTYDPAHHIQGKWRNSIFWTKESWRPHPNWVTHQLMSEMLTTFLVTISDKLQTVDESQSLALPPPLFTRDDNVGAKIAGSVMCRPALTVYSTVDGDSPTGPFKPYIQHRTHLHKTPYYQGWTLGVDIPGKPQGWIADSSNRPHSQSEAHIMFPILLSTGRVSITYLSSYENCGTLEVWITFTDPSTQRGKVSSGQQGVIGCCNHTKEMRSYYPHVKGMHASDSAFLDTLETSARVSEMRTATFNFGVAGSFALNLLHTRLPEEEITARKGDKVKILGIKSC